MKREFELEISLVKQALLNQTIKESIDRIINFSDQDVTNKFDGVVFSQLRELNSDKCMTKTFGTKEDLEKLRNDFDMLLLERLGEARFDKFITSLACFEDIAADEALSFKINEFKRQFNLSDKELIESDRTEGYFLFSSDLYGLQMLNEINTDPNVVLELAQNKIEHLEYGFRNTDFIDLLIDQNFDKFNKAIAVSQLNGMVANSFVELVRNSPQFKGGICRDRFSNLDMLWQLLEDSGYLDFCLEPKLIDLASYQNAPWYSWNR